MVIYDAYTELLSEKCVFADSLHLLPRLERVLNRDHTLFMCTTLIMMMLPAKQFDHNDKK